MYVDVFQDSTGITNLTNAVRNSSEYVDTNAVTQNTLFNYNMNHTSGTNNTGFATATNEPSGSYTSTSKYYSSPRSLYGMDSVNPMFRWYDTTGITGDFHFQCWINFNAVSDNTYYQGLSLHFGTGTNKISIYKWRSGYGSGYWVLYRDGSHNALANNGDNAWHHFAVTRSGDNMRAWFNGNSQHSWTQTASSNPLKEVILGGTNNAQYEADGSTISKCYYDNMILDNTIRSGYETSVSSFTAPTSVLSNSTSGSITATGSFESNAITAPSSTNKMGAIITYQDNAGTNTLNTDVILKLSADGGSNYSTATMTAMPDFASGIKMAKVNDLAVTAGTSLKYKIEFANQSAGSKEARIRGVSLQY